MNRFSVNWASIKIGSLCLLGVSAALAAAPSPALPPAYREARRPVEERVADLLARMTVEEKSAQRRGGWPGPDAYVKRAGTLALAEAWKPLLTDVASGMLGATLRADPWLSYTSFSHTNLSIQPSSIQPGETAQATLAVANLPQ